MGKQNKYKTLLNNTLLISLGTFGSKILTFLMVRFYTGVLTPSDYGTADLIIQTANLLLPVISMGMAEGVFRFALSHPRGRRSVFSVGVYTITAGALLFLIIAPLLSLVKTFDGYIWLIIFFTVASCYHSLCAQFVRAEGKTALFAGQGVLNTALVIGLNILFLLVFKLGITGYVLSIALADVLCTAYLVFKEKLFGYIILHPSHNAFRDMFKYSIPLIPTTIFWWITSVSDRYMVNGFLGEGANGLYAVAYKIPTLLTLLSSVFLEAWQFSAVSESTGSRREHIKFYSQIWRSFQAVMILAGSVVVAFSKFEISILSTPHYYDAWQYVPLLTMSMVFASFVTFMGSVYMVTKKSTLSFWTAMAGAVLNVLLNLLLIPSPLGVQGAAIATVASYLLSFIMRIVSAHKLIPFKLYLGRLTVSMLIFTVQTIYIVCDFPNWMLVQAICVIALIIINVKPLILAAFKILSRGSGEKKPQPQTNVSVRSESSGRTPRQPHQNSYKMGQYGNTSRQKSTDDRLNNSRYGNIPHRQFNDYRRR